MRDWLSHRADATPEATGVIALDEKRRLTFGELDEAVTRTAGRLATLGIGPGDHVGIVLPRRPAMIRLLWAVIRVGGIAVPLDPMLDAPALRRRTEDADVTMLVCGDTTERATVDAAGTVPVVSVDGSSSDRVTTLGGQQAASVAPVTWLQSDEMTIVYTAGTTADPRPVLHSMGNHFASAVDTTFRFGVSPTDRWLVCHPLHHICGLAPVLRSALAGSSLVLARDLDPGGIADTIASHRITAMSVSPPDLEAMLDARGTLSDSLRVVVAGGTAADPGLLDRCRGYSVPVYHTYCVTEAAGEVAAAAPAESADTPRSVGRPLLRMDVTVVDDAGTTVPRREVGEIVVSGPAVASGYYGHGTDGTDEQRVSHGFPTGDLGYRDEGGRIWLLSRQAGRISVDGEQVRASDIVDVVTDVPAVEAVSVVGIPDERDDSDEDGELPAALVVPGDPELDADALDVYCRERLADFVVPERFVFADSLPRSASGAVDRQAVREHILSEISTDSNRSGDLTGDVTEGDLPGDVTEGDLPGDVTGDSAPAQNEPDPPGSASGEEE